MLYIRFMDTNIVSIVITPVNAIIPQYIYHIDSEEKCIGSLVNCDLKSIFNIVSVVVDK